jgi:hypothetical protein
MESLKLFVVCLTLVTFSASPLGGGGGGGGNEGRGGNFGQKKKNLEGRKLQSEGIHDVALLERIKEREIGLTKAVARKVDMRKA